MSPTKSGCVLHNLCPLHLLGQLGPPLAQICVDVCEPTHTGSRRVGTHGCGPKGRGGGEDGVSGVTGCG